MNSNMKSKRVIDFNKCLYTSCELRLIWVAEFLHGEKIYYND